MKNITPKTVLVSMGKAVAEMQKGAIATGKQPKQATEYELPAKTIMVHGWDLMNADYSNTDDEKEVKNTLWTLQKHGYITSRIIEQTTDLGRGYRNLKYNLRVWGFTEKGLNKLREIAKERG